MTNDEIKAGQSLLAELRNRYQQRQRIRDLIKGGTTWQQLLNDPDVACNALASIMSLSMEDVEKFKNKHFIYKARRTGPTFEPEKPKEITIAKPKFIGPRKKPGPARLPDELCSANTLAGRKHRERKSEMLKARAQAKAKTMAAGAGK